MAFDFANLPPAAAAGGKARATLRATAAGKCNAVAWWFELELDGDVAISAAPGSGVRTWKQSVSYLPPRRLAPGEALEVRMETRSCKPTPPTAPTLASAKI